MPTLAYVLLDNLDRFGVPGISYDDIPSWQWQGHWGELSQHCPDAVRPEPVRRNGTRLNIETGTCDSQRCLKQSPDGRGTRWLMSGGDARDYGRCTVALCPRCKPALSVVEGADQ